MPTTWEYVFDQLAQAGRSGASPADLLKLVRVNPEIARRSSTYPSFQRGFHVLKQLGWVRRMTKTAQSYQRGVDTPGVLAAKHFYTLTPEGRSATGWDNPHKALYPEIYEDRERWKKYRKKTGRARGRPRRVIAPGEIETAELLGPTEDIVEELEEALEEVLEVGTVPKAPETVAVPKRRGRKRKPKPYTSFVVAKTFSRPSVGRLIDHLAEVIELNLDPKAAEVKQHAEALGAGLQEWYTATEQTKSNEDDKDNPDQDKVDELDVRMQALDDAIVALGYEETDIEPDFESAHSALDQAFPAPVQVDVSTLAGQLKNLGLQVDKVKTVADLQAIARLESEFLNLEKAIAERLDKLDDIDRPSQDELRERVYLRGVEERLDTATFGFKTMKQGIEKKETYIYNQGWITLRRCCTE